VTTTDEFASLYEGFSEMAQGLGASGAGRLRAVRRADRRAGDEQAFS
jgi:hypothetical protein